MSDEYYNFAEGEDTLNEGKVTFELEALGFPGYYESVFWSSDMICDEIRELVDDGVPRPFNDDEMDELYLSIDQAAYEREVNKLYMENYVDLINQYSGELISVVSSGEGVDQSSPLYYNYTTDRIFQKAEINLGLLKEIHRSCIESDVFKESLMDNFTPRSGYIPLLSNDVKDWRDLSQLKPTELNYLLYFNANNQLQKELREESIKSLCTMLTYENAQRPIDFLDAEVLNEIKNKIKAEGVGRGIEEENILNNELSMNSELGEDMMIEEKLDNGLTVKTMSIPLDEEKGLTLEYRECWDETASLGFKQTTLNGEEHGICSNYSEDSEGKREVFRNVCFRGRPVEVGGGLYKSADCERVFNFMVKEALWRSNNFYELLDDDKIFLPILRQVGDADQALEDLAENGLDANCLTQSNINPYSGDLTRNLYFNHFDAFEYGEIDMYEVAQSYMELFGVKTFPDVVVSQAVKETAGYIKDVFQESFDKTVDFYLPLLDNDLKVSLIENLSIPNNLNRIKTKIENSYKQSLNETFDKAFEQYELRLNQQGQEQDTAKTINLKETPQKRGRTL